MTEDPYGAVIAQTSADMVRAWLAYPPASPEGMEAVRRCTAWLAETHGVPGLRDLADSLAGDVAELFEVLGKVEGRSALELLDEWHHDVPPPSA
ncbi:hypothetical protein GCM10010472_04060 [Pseudonocardia halophobica]|uniref:Uncharacterized protein n=1 Tax=Pseudonocardia halophobica TaxID=29401 RepID=A0A9W6L5K9_9PSEU|nr:hypothetical protein [Pseudonocardia halophobica]GLL13365.1 hypothetical protein GCM10017577_45080 [Pseudonocardia halophobica]